MMRKLSNEDKMLIQSLHKHRYWANAIRAS